MLNFRYSLFLFSFFPQKMTYTSVFQPIESFWFVSSVKITKSFGYQYLAWILCFSWGPSDTTGQLLLFIRKRLNGCSWLYMGTNNTIFSCVKKANGNALNAVVFKSGTTVHLQRWWWSVSVVVTVMDILFLFFLLGGMEGNREDCIFCTFCFLFFSASRIGIYELRY